LFKKTNDQISLLDKQHAMEMQHRQHHHHHHHHDDESQHNCFFLLVSSLHFTFLLFVI